MMNNINPRKIALDILIDIEENKAYSNITINKYLSRYNIAPIDKGFITKLVYGVLENKLYLDYIIKQFSRTKFKKINPYIINILRIGLYQICFLDKIPNSAAVNESVKITKQINARLSGFVNGILRNYIRNLSKVVLPSCTKNPIGHLSIKYSHPKWLVELWVKEYGVDFTEKLLESNNQPPKLTIRTNTLKINTYDLIDKLKKEGVDCRTGNYVNEAVIIDNMEKSLEDLDSFKEGLFQVQDESSMVVGHVLAPNKDDFVIDVCSAPGGKATHIAELMENKGHILARDIHEHKLNLINQNTKRLGIKIIETNQYDASLLDNSLLNKADKVLIDAPCSGFGIIRRKPEIRYFKESKDIVKLSKLQLDILNTCSKYVKPNGYLIYSTCTIQSEENIGVVNRFLKFNDNFELVDINEYLPDRITTDNKYIQLYPHISGIDGFFISKLRRIK